jgi:hypothetical protein
MRSRAEAMDALHTSLKDLGYAVGESFESLLPDASDDPGGPGFVVVPSIHSADHGLRVRATDSQVYMSVVRKEGSAVAQAKDSQVDQDTDVQERTCQDLDAAAVDAGRHGLELTIGNRRMPGHVAPEMPASLWLGADRTEERSEDSDQVVAVEQPAERIDLTEQERRQQWAWQQGQAAAAERQRRSGSGSGS